MGHSGVRDEEESSAEDEHQLESDDENGSENSADEEDVDDEESGASSASESSRAHRSRHRLRVDLLPKKELPQRVTRANRYSAGEVAASDSEGDEEFWYRDV